MAKPQESAKGERNATTEERLRLQNVGKAALGNSSTGHTGAFQKPTKEHTPVSYKEADGFEVKGIYKKSQGFDESGNRVHKTKRLGAKAKLEIFDGDTDKKANRIAKVTMDKEGFSRDVQYNNGKKAAVAHINPDGDIQKRYEIEADGKKQYSHRSRLGGAFRKDTHELKNDKGDVVAKAVTKSFGFDRSKTTITDASGENKDVIAKKRGTYSYSKEIGEDGKQVETRKRTGAYKNVTTKEIVEGKDGELQQKITTSKNRLGGLVKSKTTTYADMTDQQKARIQNNENARQDLLNTAERRAGIAALRAYGANAVVKLEGPNEKQQEELGKWKAARDQEFMTASEKLHALRPKPESKEVKAPTLEDTRKDLLEKAIETYSNDERARNLAKGNDLPGGVDKAIRDHADKQRGDAAKAREDTGTALRKHAEEKALDEIKKAEEPKGRHWFGGEKKQPQQLAKAARDEAVEKLAKHSGKDVETENATVTKAAVEARTQELRAEAVKAVKGARDPESAKLADKTITEKLNAINALNEKYAPGKAALDEKKFRDGVEGEAQAELARDAKTASQQSRADEAATILGNIKTNYREPGDKTLDREFAERQGIEQSTPANARSNNIPVAAVVEAPKGGEANNLTTEGVDRALQPRNDRSRTAGRAE